MTHLALDRPSIIMPGMEGVQMEMTDKMTSINTMLVERVLPDWQTQPYSHAKGQILSLSKNEELFLMV